MNEIKSMQLEPKHIDALDMAERLVFHSDFCPYLELKTMLLDPSIEARRRFLSLFVKFYGFNVAGLTGEFKDKFFEILHGGNVVVREQPDLRGILDQLGSIKLKKGHYALYFSFASKLVAMHCEASPIYDRHVLAFFRKRAPRPSIAKFNRIQWYLDFLDYVARSYETWANDLKVAAILERLKSRDPRLTSCHVVRLMDFLVWKVGSHRLLEK